MEIDKWGKEAVEEKKKKKKKEKEKEKEKEKRKTSPSSPLFPPTMSGQALLKVHSFPLLSPLVNPNPV